ncbi:MAG: hypothetical protein AAFV96_08735 [Pseudomonadota bacterium]
MFGAAFFAGSSLSTEHLERPERLRLSADALNAVFQHEAQWWREHASTARDGCAVKRRTRSLAEAAPFCDRALELGEVEGSPEAGTLFEVGEFRREQGRLAASEDLLRRSAGLGHPHARASLALTLTQMERPFDAAAEAVLAVELVPEDRRNWILGCAILGAVAWSVDDAFEQRDQARRICSRASHYAPSDVRVFVGYSNILFMDGEYEVMARAANQLDERALSRPYVMVQRAVAALCVGDRAQGEAIFRALDARPRSIPATMHQEVRDKLERCRPHAWRRADPEVVTRPAVQREIVE